MRIRIRRQRMPHAESYWQEFEYDGPADNTVAGVLDYLNYRDDIEAKLPELLEIHIQSLPIGVDAE